MNMLPRRLRTRHLRRLCGLLLSALFLLGGGLAPALDLGCAVEFDIGPQPLTAALIQFSNQSGVQFLSAEESISSVWSNGVKGRLCVESALTSLLAGTKVEFHVVGADTVTLIRDSRVNVGEDAVARIPPKHAARSASPPKESVSTASLETVIVTAQRRSQSLQLAPLSVTVMNHEELKRRGVAALTDLISGSIPAFRVSTFIGRTSTLSIAMRGINTGDPTQISRDAGVGVYLDGVVLGRMQGLSGDLIDVERIEVLRGPQGTLFGRNAAGGAINIIPRKPSGIFGYSQTLGVHNQDGLNIVGHLDLPRLYGASVKLDAALSERGGLVRNHQVSAWDFGQYDRWGLRGQLLWDPTENFSALYAYHLSRDRATPYYLHIASMWPNARPLAPMFRLEPEPARVSRTAVPLDPSIGKVDSHSLALSWQGRSGIEIKSIAAYRELSQSQYDNWAGATESFRPNRKFGRVSISDLSQEQFSEELQIHRKYDYLDLVGGAYYLYEHATDSALEFYSNQFSETGTGASIIRQTREGIPLTRASVNRMESLAFFGHGVWTPPVWDERLSAAVGLRYSHDYKTGRLTALYGEQPPPRYHYLIDSDRADPTVSLSYRWSQDVNTYMRWSIGYRAGGANSRSLTFRTFGPEEVESWEIGLKSEFLDHTARMNMALFDMNYRDLQVGFFSPDNAVNTETINTDRPARIRGAEVDVAWAPTPGIRLIGSYVYNSVHMPAQVNPFTGEEERLASIYAPRHAATVAIDADVVTFDLGTLSIYADANYTGPQYTISTDTTRSPSAVVVSARATLSDIRKGASRFALSLWSKNLLDRHYELTEFPSSIGSLVAFGEPRSFGLELTWEL